MRFYRPELGVLELSSDEPVSELAGLHIERRDIAGDLLSCPVPEHHFQYPVGRVFWLGPDQHDQVRSNRDRRVGRRRHGEHDPDEVNASSRAGDLAQVEVLDEKGRDYVHSVPRPTCRCDDADGFVPNAGGGTAGELRRAPARALVVGALGPVERPRSSGSRRGGPVTNRAF